MLDLVNKIDIKRSYKTLHYEIWVSTILGKQKFVRKKLSDPAQNSAFGIQDYFEYITRNHEAFANNPLMQVYVNTTECINTFEVESPKIKVMKIYLN